MSRFIWRLQQRFYRWRLQRDETLSQINKQIAIARKRHAPVTFLYQAYAQRVNQILGGSL